MKKLCKTAKDSGINAVIASDIATITYARSIGIEVHISTQVNISNIESLKFYSQFADVIVLARELTLQQIKHIALLIKKENICGPSGNQIKLEIFVHGALCVAISGICHMSLSIYNASANRGACLQNCRREYRVIDEETGDELKIDNKYIMSPKDLCTISFLDQLLDAGVSVLKIEGRGKAPEYVYETVKAYREATDAYCKNEYTPEKIYLWEKQLETVYNRGFWKGGYYLGKKLGEWSGAYGSQATKEKIYVGKVKNYYAKSQIVAANLEANDLKINDEIIITGKTTGLVKEKVHDLAEDEKKVILGRRGSLVTFPSKEKVRQNDKIYILRGKNV